MKTKSILIFVAVAVVLYLLFKPKSTAGSPLASVSPTAQSNGNSLLGLNLAQSLASLLPLASSSPSAAPQAPALQAGDFASSLTALDNLSSSTPALSAAISSADISGDPTLSDYGGDG